MPKSKGRRRKPGKTSRPTTATRSPTPSPPDRPAAAAPASVSAGAVAAEGPDAEFVSSLTAAHAQLRAAAAAVHRYSNSPAALFELDELASHLQLAARGVAEHLDDLGSAEQLAQRGAALATTYGTGAVWAGRQRPRYVVRLAQLAARAEHTTTYLERLADTDTTQATSRQCPETTATGGPCGGVRVRTGDGTRARACWNHLTTEEKARIKVERDTAVTARSCPSCRAAAGQACIDHDGRPTTIHGPRLHPSEIPLPADWPTRARSM